MCRLVNEVYGKFEYKMVFVLRNMLLTLAMTDWVDG